MFPLYDFFFNTTNDTFPSLRKWRDRVQAFAYTDRSVFFLWENRRKNVSGKQQCPEKPLLKADRR